MNFFIVIAFFTCGVITNASLHHGPSAHVLQGPSSKSTVVGPDGSVIKAVATGGQIIHEVHPGVVAHAAPIYGHVAPAVSYASHSVAHHVPVVAHAAHHGVPSTVVAHSSAYGHGSTLIAGPSGTISTGHGHHVAPAVAYGVPVAHAHGHEGQYVHDHSESLHDDGSYKPHLYY